MIKNSVLIRQLFFTFTISALFVLSSCKKSSEPSTSGTLSFNFKGTQYSLPYGDGFEIGPVTGVHYIRIRRPDIFQGDIYYAPYCAYFAPGDSLVDISDNCHYKSGSGQTLDSMVIYIYYNGNHNISYDNCRTISEKRLDGSTYTYQVCDVTGTFDLVLKNNENKSMTITDGKIQLFNF